MSRPDQPTGRMLQHHTLVERRASMGGAAADSPASSWSPSTPPAEQWQSAWQNAIPELDHLARYQVVSGLIDKCSPDQRAGVKQAA